MVLPVLTAPADAVLLALLVVDLIEVSAAVVLFLKTLWTPVTLAVAPAVVLSASAAFDTLTNASVTVENPWTAVVVDSASAEALVE